MPKGEPWLRTYTEELRTDWFHCHSQKATRSPPTKTEFGLQRTSLPNPQATCSDSYSRINFSQGREGFCVHSRYKMYIHLLVPYAD